MGILNALTKLGCSHDWDWWQGYDGSFTNMTVAVTAPSRLESCYKFRRCDKCKGIETKWEHNWRNDPDSVTAQREWERKHANTSSEYHGPGIMMECSSCGKRDPQFVVMGD